MPPAEEAIKPPRAAPAVVRPSLPSIERKPVEPARPAAAANTAAASTAAANTAAANTAAASTAAASTAAGVDGGAPPIPPRRTPPPPPPPPAAPRAFDWERLVGVRLFSAIAGIAMVVAAILFLRHSMQEGWLQPQVRVLIGIAVGVGLLVMCEMKAARKYPATANALDAAAIAILFSTFFAAHALWHLIPAALTFALLAAVTALAVLLSIRRESLFIAVLGLLGGFATPALLSTGENQPIPLFAYLVLLNVGLAWVAYRQVWPVLTFLTLILTTIYQWGWMFKFLAASDLPLALGIFAVFPALSVASLLFGRIGRIRTRTDEDENFERTTAISAALPLVFAAYLAAVPAYGARPGLLFGFLLLIDAGLLAVALVLRRPVLHGVAAIATVFVPGVWLARSYVPAARPITMAFTVAFAALYLFAPSLARWFSRPFDDRGLRTAFAAPALLFVFPVVAAIDPGVRSAAPFFGPLAALVLLCGWRAAALGMGGVFFVASFFAVAAQAVWSARHLDLEHLRQAVVVYAVFGVIAAAVPVLARRAGRALEPRGGSAVVLLASLALLLFLSAGTVAPAALWALALLLAILNAAMFVESASGRMPLLAQIGSLFSWGILARWWLESAGAMGVLPSLAVVTGLALVTLAGHGWAYASIRRAGQAGAPRGADEPRRFADGVYLGLVGHLFLFVVGMNRGWSVPPWPLFGALAVMTLAASTASLASRLAVLHVAAVAAAAVVISGWTAAAAVMPWTLVGLFAAAALVAYSGAWLIAGGRSGLAPRSPHAAAAALFGLQVTVILAAAAHEPPPFGAVLAAHAVAIAGLLALTYGARWKRVSAAAAALSWLALLQWQVGRDLVAGWPQLLTLAAVIYLLFTLNALVAGPRLPERREPWLVALAAAAMTFFAARDAFTAGGLAGMIGIIPVVQAAVSCLLLRSLLRLQPSGERDMTRLALVAGTALTFVTVAIPLQLDHQWITIGWALEGAALAWLYGRVPHRGVLGACAALLAAVFVRLALNPSIWTYEPRGELRIFNWYLYTYVVAAAAMFAAAWLLSKTSDRIVTGLPRLSQLLPAAGVILLFILLNIEIADYYAVGPEITFRFGVTVSQDLTYTIGWLAFGMLLLAAGISLRNRPARITAVALIAVTTFKCFLYDLKSLEGLHRVGSFVGLAIALALVSLALQKFVLTKSEESA
jgi:hypothetical protein